jgi:peptidoglycan hydrolase-like protein with peptidoglycan-binding domain
VGGYYGYPYNYGYPYGYAYDYPNGYPYGDTYAYDNEYPYSTYGPVTRTVTTTRSRDLAYNDNLVVAVQERLAQAGYYHGAIDAVAGPETRSAIARWEADHGLNADGLIDEQTLHAMGVS